jgi:hypothetical protein
MPIASEQKSTGSSRGARPGAPSTTKSRRGAARDSLPGRSDAAAKRRSRRGKRLWRRCLDELSDRRLGAEHRRTLETWIQARNTPQKVAFRSRIVLLAAGGQPNRRIAQELKTIRPTVILRRQRFLSGGPAALAEDRPGRGCKVDISDLRVKQVVDATLHSLAVSRHFGRRA